MNAEAPEPTSAAENAGRPTDTPPVETAGGSSDGGDTGRTCQVCGRTGSGPDLLQWVMDRRADRLSWTCPSCAATHIRSLEAKLEPEWW